MDHQRTGESSECLGFVGLSYLNSEFDEGALTAARNITCLAEQYARKLKGVSSNDLPSLLLPLRWIKLLARQMNRTATLERLEEIEQEVLAKLSDLGDLKTHLDELERERREEMSRPFERWSLDPYEPETLLAKILNRRQQTT